MTRSRRIDTAALRARARRAVAATSLLIVAGGAAACGGSGDDDYVVRAIFDSAAFVNPGLKVRTAGVKIGEVTGVELTDDNYGAVTFNITDPGFQDFRTDAFCTIRPQALIGERYIQCEITEPRPAGATAAPPIKPIADGPHRGEHLLPVDRTAVPVDADQVLQTAEAGPRERFAMILRELGAGVAGRGEQINKTLRKSNPALRQTNLLLKQLDAQKETLKALIVSSDQTLANLAAERASISGAIANGDTVMNRLATRRNELRQTINQLDRLLGEVPTSVDRFTELTRELEPVTADLARSSKELATVIDQLPALASRSRTAFNALGPVAAQATTVLTENQPFWDRTIRLAAGVRTSLGPLGLALGDFRSTGGLDYFLDAIWGLAFTTNGRDAGGSFLRGAGINLLRCALPDNVTNETACGSWSLATEAANAPGGARSSGGAGGGRFQTAPSTVKRDESAGEAPGDDAGRSGDDDPAGAPECRGPGRHDADGRQRRRCPRSG